MARSRKNVPDTRWNGLAAAALAAQGYGNPVWDITFPANNGELSYDANLGFQLQVEGSTGFYVQASPCLLTGRKQAR